MYVKIWNGNAWEIKELKVNSGGWNTKDIYYWTGSEWKKVLDYPKLLSADVKKTYGSSSACGQTLYSATSLYGDFSFEDSRNIHVVSIKLDNSISIAVGSYYTGGNFGFVTHSFTPNSNTTTTHTLTVVVANDFGETTATTCEFYTTPPPQAFTLSSPADGSNPGGPNVTLSWNASTYATSYDVYVNGDLQGNTTSTSYGITVPSGPYNWTWHVVAKNDYGSYTSDTWHFGW